MSTLKNTKEAPKMMAIILAAGRGTRMCSPLAKVLHPVAGMPMIRRVIDAAKKANIEQIRVVVSPGNSLLRTVVEPLGVTCHEQIHPQGTGDAVRAADIESLEGDVFILNGDHPLIEATDLEGLYKEFVREKCDLAVVTACLKKPGAFGRVVRNQGELYAIVEAKDASRETLKINEVNTGLYIVNADLLKELLPRIKNNNIQKEYYLTDLIELAREGEYRIKAIKGSVRLARGVNTQRELAMASEIVFQRKLVQLMESGVVVLDPKRTYVEPEVEVGQASVIFPGVYLRGKTKIGSFCAIEPNVYIVDSELGDSVQIKAGSYIEKTKIRSRAAIGPYARLRPDTEIGEEAHVGNFVELKKVNFGKRSKAGHLTYLGDADIGEDVNIGCGTITCNYAVDRKKYRTKIGDRVFVGSDSQFVAPVEVGDDAVIGSGSTITKDVPARALGVARSRQIVKENYVPVIPVLEPEVK